jgi:hypothetical protein
VSLLALRAPFFEHLLAQPDLAVAVDIDHLDPDDVADFEDILDSLDAAMSDFRDVEKTVSAR